MGSTLQIQSVAGIVTALVLMGGRLGMASEQPGPDLTSWPLDCHVRSSDDRLLKALRDGVARSPTLRDLMAYLVHRIVTAGNRRYLKVVVNRELARDRLTSVIAHELQHAREVAEAANVRSSAEMGGLFKRLDSGRCVLIRSCTETDAAVRLQAAVLGELNAGR